MKQKNYSFYSKIVYLLIEYTKLNKFQRLYTIKHIIITFSIIYRL